MSNSQVLLLAKDGPTTRMVFNALCRQFGSPGLILEASQSRFGLARRRVHHLGIVTVAGQIAFTLAVRPILEWRARQRIKEIKQQFDLDDAPIADQPLRVESINSAAAVSALAQFNPKVIVVNGTRVLAPVTLRAIRCPIMNMHCGITPAYRGVHGGYWALVEQRPHLVGTTVHYIDAGIDTGPIIAQTTFSVSRRDSLATYPYLHTAAGMPLLIQAVSEALAGNPPSCKPAPEIPSKLRSHPTLWGYLRGRLRYGVR